MADDDAAPVPEPLPVAPPRPLDPAARERERDRLLTLANVHRMRGQTREAGSALQQALALGGPGDGPGTKAADAPIHEMLGDLLAAQGEDEAARDAYDNAHQLDPARASAERKFAQMTLRLADMKALAALGEAVRKGEAPPPDVVGLASSAGGKRSAGLALLASLALPGFGQFYNGQFVKGAICLGVFLLTLAAVRLSPDSGTLFAQITSLLAARPAPGAKGTVSPLLWLLILASGATWLYALADAVTTAGKGAKPGGGISGPTVDKSGWEV